MWATVTEKRRRYVKSSESNYITQTKWTHGSLPNFRGFHWDRASQVGMIGLGWAVGRALEFAWLKLWICKYSKLALSMEQCGDWTQGSAYTQMASPTFLNTWGEGASLSWVQKNAAFKVRDFFFFFFVLLKWPKWLCETLKAKQIVAYIVLLDISNNF